MNRMLRTGLLSATMLGLCVGPLDGGDFKRPAAANGTPTGPAWLEPTARVQRTEYLELSKPPAPSGLAPRTLTDPRPLVFVLDGAGELRGCSNALMQANISGGNLVELSAFPWSHGYRRLLLDQVDLAHTRMHGGP